MMFMHCAKCIQEKPKNMSMEKYSRLDVGLDAEGILIGCRRHQIPVVYLTPESLTKLLENQPKCDMCEQGVPHSH
jgi:hypothetical protein